MSDLLLQNSLIEPTPGIDNLPLQGLYRILWVDASNDLLVAIAIQSPLKAPCEFQLSAWQQLLEGRYIQPTALTLRPFALQDDDSLPEHYLTIRAKSWAIIEPLVCDAMLPWIYHPKHRGSAIAQRAKTLAIPPSQLRRLLYKYWAYGSTINALLPCYDLCGPQGSKEERRTKPTMGKRGRRPVRVLFNDEPDQVGISAASVRSRLIAGITEFLQPDKTITKAYEETIKKHFNKGYERHGKLSVPIMPEAHEKPSIWQFRYLIQQLDYNLSLTKKQIDTSTWNLAFRGSYGSSRSHLFGPCARFEVDATIMDIYLVSTLNRAWIIGRPVLYVIVDVFSAMVVGFHLGLEGPSWEGARLALFNAFSDKVEFCKSYGVEITQEDWPCHHLPHKLLSDNGEMRSKASDTLTKTLNIDVENAAVRRGDWKPNIEQQFHLINEGTIRFLPGALVQREREVRKRGNPLDACINLRELTSILIRRFLQFNHSRYKADRLPPEMVGEGLLDATPLAVWNWGIANKTGRARREDPQIIWTALLPKAIASIRPKGLYFDGRHYINNRLCLEERFARARTRGKYDMIEIRYLSYAPKQIWIKNKENRSWEACYLVEHELSYAQARQEELWDQIQILNYEAEKKQNAQKQINSRLDAECDDIVQKAQAATKEARQGLSKARIAASITSHRAIEKEAGRAERLRQDVESYRTTSPLLQRTQTSPAPTMPDPLEDIW
ncbi:DDE-type integrase/transposase/recombinase [Chromobacterium sp. Panama]|uniref:DDE-type integrase/transposase/recombinase n=1 Tax=Chromobacterium sp. Panama TaxID=2161826 RepID=UPI001304BBE6|nr:DDE-type integrase/transposase/recombinase [Chromobacterium sp. Panama]